MEYNIISHHSEIQTVSTLFRKEALNTLSNMQLQGQLCDAIICTEDSGVYHVHKSILVTCSSYFRALFTTYLTNRGRSYFTIPGVKSSLLHHIISYAYTRETQVNQENVADLLAAADQFNVMGMVSDCSSYMIKNLTVHNSIGVWRLAEIHFCPILASAACRFILSNFMDVAKYSDEILELPIDMLTSILASDELNVNSEELVWRVIVRWVDYDTPDRLVHVPELLKCIRLGLIRWDTLMYYIKNHHFVTCNEQCLLILSASANLARGCNFQAELPETCLNFLRSNYMPRIPHDLMFCIGGWSGDGPTAVVEVYDVRADMWVTSNVCDTSGPRAYHKCAVIGWRIFVVGGTDGAECLNSCRSFNTLDKSWKEISPMYARRCYLSLAVLGQTIYVMGGYDGIQRLQSAECYDHFSNQWMKIAPMRQQRSDAGSSVVNGYIYVVGGFNGVEYLNTVEYYDRTYDVWTIVAHMNSRRSGVSCITFGNSLYAVGGFNGMYRLETAEKYDQDTKTWMCIEDMHKKRSNFAIEAIDDSIFVSGGFNGKNTVNEVERYDPNINQWQCVAPMATFRSALAACVVSVLPNVRDYMPFERQVKIVNGQSLKSANTPRIYTHSDL